ncbi:MAG: hypothetical protein WBE26_18015 [Phycisphaerae bacterium]
MAAIPGVMKPPWWDREWLVELVAGGGAALAIVGSIWEQSSRDDDSNKGFIFLVIALVWLLAAAIVKVARARRRDKRRIRMESPADLRGCTQVLYYAIKQACDLSDDEQDALRITIHRIIKPENRDEDPEQLEQVIPYVGGKGGGEGRTFSIQTGIIGRVARSHTPFAATRENDDHEAYIAELVKTWGYHEQDARKLSTVPRSWMAIPINGDNEQDTIGVVYLDSNQRDLFSDDKLQELVIRSCFGIAEYVRARYTYV